MSILSPDPDAGLTRLSDILPDVLIDLADAWAAHGSPHAADLRDLAMSMWSRRLWRSFEEAA